MDRWIQGIGIQACKSGFCLVRCKYSRVYRASWNIKDNFTVFTNNLLARLA